jgi:hypothetical protein
MTRTVNAPDQAVSLTPIMTPLDPNGTLSLRQLAAGCAS